jgi:hypothetical protein
MHIEVFALGAPILVFVLLLIISKVTLYTSKWRYKPEYDKGRPLRRGGIVKKAELSFTGSTPVKGQELLQTTTSDTTRTDKSSDTETIGSSRKVGKRRRNPFRRRKA